jgi:hypothetical protein
MVLLTRKRRAVSRSASSAIIQGLKLLGKAEDRSGVLKIVCSVILASEGVGLRARMK